MSSVVDEIKANILEAQKLTRKHLVIELDFSEGSLEELESHIDTVDYAWPGGKSEENLDLLARIWGSYLGEVLRQRCGGQWVREQGEKEDRYALRANQMTIYPHEQVKRRLCGDSKESIWAYFLKVRHQA